MESDLRTSGDASVRRATIVAWFVILAVLGGLLVRSALLDAQIQALQERVNPAGTDSESGHLRTLRTQSYIYAVTLARKGKLSPLYGLYMGLRPLRTAARSPHPISRQSSRLCQHSSDPEGSRTEKEEKEMRLEDTEAQIPTLGGRRET